MEIQISQSCVDNICIPVIRVEEQISCIHWLKSSREDIDNIDSSF